MSLLRLSRCCALSSRLCPHSSITPLARLHITAVARGVTSTVTIENSQISESTTKATKPARKRRRKTVTKPLSDASLTEENAEGPPLDDLLLELYKPKSDLVSLKDLEVYKPEKITLKEPSTYKKEQYEPLFDLLTRRFSRDQLAQVVEEANLRTKSNRKKSLAEAILQLWGLPHPEKVRREQEAKTKQVEEAIELDAPRLFHVIGKEARGMRSLSERFHVLVDFSHSPLGLWVKGSQESINEVRRVVKEVAEGVISQTYTMPSHQPLPAGLVQRLSRLTDTFIQNLAPNGEISIAALTRGDMERAYRLAVKLTTDFTPARLFALQHRDGTISGLPVAAQPMYAMFPFYARTLSWSSVGAFTRLRRTGDWLGLDLRDDVKGEAGLSGNGGSILTVTGVNPTVLRDKATAYFPLLAESPYTHRTITASPGHVIFPAEASQRAGDLPVAAIRTAANSTYEAMLSWIARTPRPQFLPGLPAELADAQPSLRRQSLRLIYQARVAEHYDEFIQLPYLRAAPFMEFEYLVSSSHEHATTTSTCKNGMTMETLLLQPQRFMDMRLTASDYNLLRSADQPPEIVAFWENLKSSQLTSERPPLVFTWQDQEYVLLHHESVEETDESLFNPDLKVSRFGKVDMEVPITEERAASCAIQLDEDTNAGWAQFYAQCDRLTGRGFTPLLKTGLSSLEELPGFNGDSL